MPTQVNKAGSAAGAGYIVGTGEGFNRIQYVNDGSARSALGRKDDKPLYDAIDDKIVTIDMSLGENDANKQNNHYSVKDRNYPVASGYAKNGVPSYGDGRVLTTLTYSNDTNDEKANVKFNYAAQASGVSIKYSSLSN